jgi:hypothetical protein
MSIQYSSRQVPANNTAPEGAPICGLSTSTTDVSATSHDANESEQADELAIGVGVPATARSAEHVVGNQSDHGNPPDQIPQPCVDPSYADPGTAFRHPFLWRIIGPAALRPSIGPGASRPGSICSAHAEDGWRVFHSPFRPSCDVHK